MKFTESRTILGLVAYCYSTTTNTTFGAVLGPSAGLLATLPVIVNTYTCLTGDGTPLVIRLDIYGSLTGGSSTLLLTSTVNAYYVKQGVYLSENETYVISHINLTSTG
jgi:hypothetical protein